MFARAARPMTVPAALLLLLCAFRAEAEPHAVTGPTGPVVDEAELIPEVEEARLDAKLRAYRDKERTAIVVSTIASLQGQNIEEFATARFNSWGIGDAETDRGVLILVARDERRARIEVGCGLETVLTDPVAKDIMENDLIPLLHSGDFPGGIDLAIDGIAAALATATVEPGPASTICLAAAA